MDGFRNEDKEVLVVWKGTRNRTNHVWGQVKVVGRAIDIFVGDVVVRGKRSSKAKARHFIVFIMITTRVLMATSTMIASSLDAAAS